MVIQIQLRNDTSANWTTNNPILAQGEMGLETDTRRKKIGDGVTHWTSLPYDFTSGSMTSAIEFVIDGGGVVITTGSKGTIMCPFAGTITSWALIGDVSGSIVVDVKKSTFANYPTTSSITGTDIPTLSSSQKSTSVALTGWTTSVTKGDIFEFVVNSATTITRVTLYIEISRS